MHDQAPPALAGTYSDDLWNGGDDLRELGVDLLGARIYDPTIGRFLQRDPLMLSGSASRSNPYAFAFDDPLDLSDPSGMCPDGTTLCIEGHGQVSSDDSVDLGVELGGGEFVYSMWKWANSDDGRDAASELGNLPHNSDLGVHDAAHDLADAGNAVLENCGGGPSSQVQCAKWAGNGAIKTGKGLFTLATAFARDPTGTMRVLKDSLGHGSYARAFMRLATPAAVAMLNPFGDIEALGEIASGVDEAGGALDAAGDVDEVADNAIADGVDDGSGGSDGGGGGASGGGEGPGTPSANRLLPAGRYEPTDFATDDLRVEHASRHGPEWGGRKHYRGRIPATRAQPPLPRRRRRHPWIHASKRRHRPIQLPDERVCRGCARRNDPYAVPSKQGTGLLCYPVDERPLWSITAFLVCAVDSSRCGSRPQEHSRYVRFAVGKTMMCRHTTSTTKAERTKSHWRRRAAISQNSVRARATSSLECGRPTTTSARDLLPPGAQLAVI